MLARLHSQHELLRSYAAELVRLVDSEAPCDLDALASARWRLARMVLQHLALEERCVFRPLAQDNRPDVAVIAMSFRNELDATHARYKDHVDYWTRHRIESDWSTYARSVRHMVDFLNERLDREEAELYPLVTDGGDEAGRSPEDRNWAGDGWLLREKIERAAA